MGESMRRGLKVGILALTGLSLCIVFVYTCRGAPWPDPPLLIAASKGDEQEVRHLLNAGEPVNSVNENGETALVRAFQSRNMQMFDLLLEKGANLNALTNRGETALSFAVRSGDQIWIKHLIGLGALRVYTDTSSSNWHHSPLHEAAGKGDDQSVTLLISSGMDPLLRDEDGLTPLDWARRARRRSTIAILKGLTKNATQHER